MANKRTITLTTVKSQVDKEFSPAHALNLLKTKSSWKLNDNNYTFDGIKLTRNTRKAKKE